MSGYARITGQIRIDPPIGWRELMHESWATGDEPCHYPDVRVKVDTQVTTTDDGEIRRHLGVAVISGREPDGHSVVEDADRIVRRFKTTPGGEPRTFTGHLHIVWGGGEAIYRVVVRDGCAVEVHPTVTWPDDAREVAP